MKRRPITPRNRQNSSKQRSEEGTARGAAQSRGGHRKTGLRIEAKQATAPLADLGTQHAACDVTGERLCKKTPQAFDPAS
jgi:hypothetical protein